MFYSAGQMMWSYMGWWAWFFWALIICGLAYLFWLYVPRGRAQVDDPMEIARMRYAKGEITAEEYEKIIQKLKETQ